jgi:methylmalonyl-CoA mutase N-terminal domain/subunit
MTLKEAYERWKREVLGPLLSRYPERKPRFETSSGIEMPRFLLPPHEDPDYEQKLGFPGAYPFTRGIQPTMYRGRLWTMRQYAGYATAEETNRRFRYLLEQGQTGFRWPLTFPRRSDTMPIIRWRPAKWGRWAFRSPRWKIWSDFLRAFRWRKSRPR